MFFPPTVTFWASQINLRELANAKSRTFVALNRHVLLFDFFSFSAASASACVTISTGVFAFFACSMRFLCVAVSTSAPF